MYPSRTKGKRMKLQELLDALSNVLPAGDWEVGEDNDGQLVCSECGSEHILFNAFVDQILECEENEKDNC
jgi:hypothetical protein